MEAILTLDEFKRIDFTKDFVREIEITPDIAEYVLNERNTCNRKIKADRVRQYVSDMKNGDWCRKCAIINFANDGMLLNGQHTFTAIVKSGISQSLVCSFGQPRSDIIHIDVLSGRTTADNFTIAGEKSMLSDSRGEKTVLAVMNVLYSPNRATKYTDSQKKHFYGQFPNSFEKAFAFNGKRNKLCNQFSLAAALFALASGVNDDAIGAFFECGYNNVENKSKYNVKAALDAKESNPKIRTQIGKIKYYETVLYCFIKRVKTTSKEVPYPMTEEALNSLEMMLGAHDEAKSANG